MIAPAIPKGRALPQGLLLPATFPDPLGSAAGSSSLLSVVAHELRAPLRCMLAGAEVLLEQGDTLDPSTVGDTLSTIRHSTIRLVEVVENLLCASSIRAGRFALQRQALDPAVIVSEVQGLTAPMLQPRGQVLRLASRGRIPAVAADHRRIGQALRNLISNASKVSPPEREIDVTLSAGPERVRFTVGDRGPGLPPGSGQRLFEPCRRDDSTLRAGGAGIGLGLPVVRAIVEAHDGRVGARNRRGGGATVWFELPKAAASGLTAELWGPDPR
jgi:two-component system sensor histidine kinase KdpD